jgi:hypothetical protein
MGMTASERFPVYADRFPIQLLAYLRLTRIQVGCRGVHSSASDLSNPFLRWRRTQALLHGSPTPHRPAGNALTASPGLRQ